MLGWIRIIALLFTPSLLVGCTTTPEPLDARKNSQRATTLLEETIQAQEKLSGPVSLYEAMARALKYNLDHKIELMEEALRFAQLDMRHYDMLPMVMLNSGYNRRDVYSGGSSRSLVTGRQSLEASTSSDLGVQTSDVTLSWDVLDFGLSYVRAKQAGDEVQIARERRRKVVNRIVEDVRTTYWRAVSADRILQRLVDLETEAVQALRNSAEMEERRIVSPNVVLTYQRELLQVQTEVQRLQRELTLSKTQLAALMNVRPDSDFELVLPDRTDAVPVLPGAVEDMLMVALTYRPEMRESALKLRTVDREKDVALLQSLPSVKLMFGLNQDSNSFLYNKEWTAFASRISFNLINVFRYPAYRSMLDHQEEALRQRDLALTMAVMTQVHVARIRFVRYAQELNAARRLQKVHAQLAKVARSSYSAKAISQQALVREEMGALLSEIRYDIAYADLQNSYASLYSSMGLDNYGEDFDMRADVKTLATQLHTHWNDKATSLPALER